MNQINPGFPLLKHQRTASNFRDHSLLWIFQISLTSLHKLKNDTSIEVSGVLRKLTLSLSTRCLFYAFRWSSLVESSVEFGTTEMPCSWKPVMEDPSTLQIFFHYYKFSEPPLKEALESLVRLASVRQSVFKDDASHSWYLANLMAGTIEILQTYQGLDDPDNYHEFCHFLGCFKLNYQLSEIVNIEIYGDWIRLVAEFTTNSLMLWKWTSSSLSYLLGLWARLVTSMPNLKGGKPSLLDEIVPKLIEGFITSRFSSVQEDLSENLLDNVELLEDQLDFFSFLCIFQYPSSSVYIISRMEPILRGYTELGRTLMPGDASDLSVIEGKLTWIVHIIASIIKISPTTNCSESPEIIDAELAARVLQLINLTDSGLHSQRYQEVSRQRLDCAIVTFFQNFRDSYIGDNAMALSKTKLYSRLSELLGLHDQLVLLNFIFGKIATNLKCYTECEVIKHTLALFEELASRHMSGNLLFKLDGLMAIMANHTRENFPFLGKYSYSRYRTDFYYTLGCLIFMEDSPVKFRPFMDPLLQVMVSLESTPDAAFHTDAVKCAFIGLMRDLRGIAKAANSRKTYRLLFDWLYPSHMPLLLKVISNWTGSPEVTIPLLKFMAEFVSDRSQRLAFDSSSPNGILLFREVSKLIVVYGSGILLLPNNTDIYTMKYKGLSISLTILSSALAGNYVNFGVFELYGDKALSEVLDISLRMILSVPLEDMCAFPKLKKAFFGFVDALFSRITYVLNLDTNTFMHLVGSLESGLKRLDLGISSQCASAVDKLASFYFNNITVGEEPGSPAALILAQRIAECPALFPEILKTLFEIVLSEDFGNVLDLSRPMVTLRDLSRPILSLILVSEQIFIDLKAHILASLPSDEQQCLSKCFDNLMADVTRSLDSKNRDRFTKNLDSFRQAFLVPLPPAV